MNLKNTSISMVLRAIDKKLFVVSTLLFYAVLYMAGYIGWDTGITNKWGLVAWSAFFGLEAAVFLPKPVQQFMEWVKDHIKSSK